MSKSVLKTLSECIYFYAEDCLARGQSDRTVEEKVLTLKKFAVWCQSKEVELVTDITQHTLEAYRRHIRAYRKRNGDPLDISTIRLRLTGIKVFFENMFYHEVIEINPAQKFILPKVPRKLPSGYLKMSEFQKMLDQTTLHGATGIRDRAVLATFLSTGLRRMEIALLRIADMDMESELVTVYQGKGNRDRRVPIAKSTCELVSYYLTHIRPSLATVMSQDYLFIANDGKPYNASRLSYLVSTYIKRAGLRKKGSCSLLRHSTATLMHENGADIRHVQAMLGHAHISTTQIYTHVSPNKLKEVYKKTHPIMKSTDSVIEAPSNS